MSVLKYAPAVFAVGNEYQIVILVKESSVMWIKIGDKTFYDHSNGVLRSSSDVHKITVPAHLLNKEMKYTVCYRKMIERKPYFSETGDVEEIDFYFTMIPEDRVTLYQIADAHGMVKQSIAAAKVFEEKYGQINILVLNGDVIDHSGDVKNFEAIYAIAEGITAGACPIIFSRGNHDTRGIYAEIFENYTPTRYGKSYFDFELPGFYGVVLDCGEDKLDSHPEYGNTNCHEHFRREETEYLKNLATTGQFKEAEDKKKLVIAHVPFSMKFPHPFNIEEDTYKNWCKTLKNCLKPDVMLAGHTHRYAILRENDENDAFGVPCPAVVGSAPNTRERTFAGAGLIFEGKKITAVFTNENEVTKELVI